MNRRFALIFVIALLLLSACSAAAPTMSASMPQEAPMAAPAAEESFSREYDAGTGADSFAPGKQEAAEIDRMVIRNAVLDIVVVDPAKEMSTISRMAEEMGGFVVTSSLYKYTSDGVEYPQGGITVRVPAEQLNDALDTIKGLVEDPINDVLSESVTGEDVTKTYTDLSSQLRNYEEAETQLREIMGSATRTEDVLAVHNQLTQVRERIEVIRGQMQYYEEAAALSSIQVTLRAKASVQPLDIGGWRPDGVARDAAQALINALEFIGSAAIWILLFFLPIAVLLAAPFVIIWLIVRRVRRNRKAKAVTPPPPAAQ